MNPTGKKQRTRDKVLLFLSTCSMASTEQIKKHLGVAGKGSKTLNLCLSLRDLGLLIQRSTDGGFSGSSLPWPACSMTTRLIVQGVSTSSKSLAFKNLLGNALLIFMIATLS